MAEKTQKPFYPEHEKLKKVSAKSQACGEFLDWLRHEKGFLLAKSHHHTEHCYAKDEGKPFMIRVCDTSTGALEGVGYISTQDLLAEFFEIDQAALEKEKEQLLEEQRELNKKSSAGS